LSAVGRVLKSAGPGQRRVSIGEQLQRPGGVSREVGHATRYSGVTVSRRDVPCFCEATDARAGVSDIHRTSDQSGASDDRGGAMKRRLADDRMPPRLVDPHAIGRP
jgi:hypothetical protein